MGSVTLEAPGIAGYDPAMSARQCIPLFCLAGFLALAACSSGAKKVRAPDAAKALAAEAAAAAGPVKQGIQRPWDPVRRTKAIAYCVSRQLNTPDGLLAIAQEDCKGGTLAYYGQDNGLRYCPLFQAHRMTFICYAPPPVPAPADE